MTEKMVHAIFLVDDTASTADLGLELTVLCIRSTLSSTTKINTSCLGHFDPLRLCSFGKPVTHYYLTCSVSEVRLHHIKLIDDLG